MHDEPELPPEPEPADPAPGMPPPAAEDRVTEAMADDIAAEEAREAEQARGGRTGGGGDGGEWDGSAPAPAHERGPSKLGLVAVAAVALLAGAGTAYAVSHRGGGCLPKGDALKVEGATISNAEFSRRIVLLRALYDVRPPTDPKQLANFKGEAAKGLAQGVLVAHDVAKRHLQAPDKDIRDGLDRFIAQRYPQGGDSQFVQALGTYGLSEDDVLAEFRRLLETSRLFQAVTADVKVGEDQITTTFNQKKDQLAVPERRHLRNIQVATEDEANKALARINGPETFGAVAKAVSTDPATKDSGGDLGTVSEAQLDPAFGKAAFAAAKGAVFGPVLAKSGWFLGLVVEIIPGHPVTLTEVHDQLRDSLLAAARLAEFQTYVTNRLRGADACYAKGNRPANPKTPANVTPSTLTPGPATTPSSAP